MSIVLVEDNEALNYATSLLLKKENYSVRSFFTASSLIDNIKREHVDLFILDINLPDMDGIELMAVLKPYYEKSDYIFISSNNDMKYINKAYALGCEDYLKKPFEIEELLLKVKKIKQRRLHSNRISLHEISMYTYDFSSRSLYYNDEIVLLTNKERELLYCLFQQRGAVVTFDTLADEVWRKSVPHNTIVATIRRLRKKLHEDFITTIREVGYLIV